MLLTRSDKDVIDSAANSNTFFTVSPRVPALYITVSCDRELSVAPARAEKRAALCSPNEQRRFVLLSVCLSSVALVNRA